MISKQCALCDIEITSKNDSKEHVIPHSIGGRKWVRGFLCISCNNGTGATWDAELAKQYHFLSLLFSVSRDRAAIPPLVLPTKDSDSVILHADGYVTYAKPTFEVINTDEGVQVQIRA